MRRVGGESGVGRQLTWHNRNGRQRGNGKKTKGHSGKTARTQFGPVVLAPSAYPFSAANRSKGEPIILISTCHFLAAARPRTSG